MNKSELIALLYSLDEEEVFIEKDDFLCEIEVSVIEEVFDGFDTMYPSSIVLKAKEEKK